MLARVAVISVVAVGMCVCGGVISAIASACIFVLPSWLSAGLSQRQEGGLGSGSHEQPRSHSRLSVRWQSRCCL